MSAIANSIACNLSDEKLDLVAAIFSQLGDTLSTICAQREFIAACKNKADSSNSSGSKETTENADKKASGDKTQEKASDT